MEPMSRDEVIGWIGALNREHPCYSLTTILLNTDAGLRAQVAALEQHQQLHDRIFARQKLLLDEAQAERAAQQAIFQALDRLIAAHKITDLDAHALIAKALTPTPETRED
jgi:hypothetical protein